MPKITRLCIACDKDVSNCASEEHDDFNMPPDGATVWTSHGNYGSTIYDPISGGEYLECYICDECVTKKADRVFHVKPTHVINSNVKTFAQHEKEEKEAWEKSKTEAKRLEELRAKHLGKDNTTA